MAQSRIAILYSKTHGKDEKITQTLMLYSNLNSDIFVNKNKINTLFE